MNTESTLLQAIHAAPEDDLAWLALADWLEEHGQPGRAELLRLHRMWDRLPRIDAWYERIRGRASVKKELVERMGPEDRAPFEKLEGDPWPTVEKLAWEC